ncbi:DUF559 domain-containing protein [Actinoplanes sp. NPDC024001]|uniref:DUF559 domain-containing protein n=1 Tax=Actinoplanes sp. NPDC024001 TaxID=3154598 RepID=UPI0033D7AD88
MAVQPHLPIALSQKPFRGSSAIMNGLLTKGMLRGRRWRRLLPDVYVDRDTALDHGLWCSAVGLVLPDDAAIGGLSAAYLWGIDLLSPAAPVSVVTPRDRRLSRATRISPHYTVIGDGDLTAQAGLSVTTPERTAFDLGRRLNRSAALVVIDAMLHAKALNIEAVGDLARQRHWWPNVSQLKEVLCLADPRAESPMETRLRLVLHDAGVPPGIPQFEVHDDRGMLIGRVDLAWPAARLAIEYEGDHHRERDQFRRDVDRINRLRMAGWTVLRFTAEDVLRKPQLTAAIVTTELARLH